MKQSEINALLIEKAAEGYTVVRLKGGDPSVFGRVGEEAEALHQHGIRYEMVPGITSGIAAPLYAGVPVTHRDFASSFAMITAHDTSLQGRPNLDWEGLARSVQTLVFYMGVKNLSFICRKLMEYGKSPPFPYSSFNGGRGDGSGALKERFRISMKKFKAKTSPTLPLSSSVILSIFKHTAGLKANRSSDGISWWSLMGMMNIH